MASDARVCAHRVLLRVFERGAYADKALHSCAAGLPSRDRALAMRLSYGAVQRKATLDHAIEALAKRPAKALDPAVRASLRIGLYELCYGEGGAAHAVVHDAVELVKRSGSHGHGLVNAVLRRAAEQRSTLLAGLPEGTPAQAALAHSHPQWLAEMWWSQLGPQRARSLMAADNEPAERALRVNTLVADAAEVIATLANAGEGAADLRSGSQTGPFAGAALACPANPLLGISLPEGIVLSGAFDLRSSPQWGEGAIVAQSRAAMLVAHVLDPQRGERVLDLCAAPGGKTTHIAALMEGEGEVVAIERHPGRAHHLRETVDRMRASNVKVQTADASALELGRAGFDRVLLDAPCSGLGTLQSHPDLRWRANPTRMRELADLQCKILVVAADAVRAGGTLVYSTCTISNAENERQIERFLEARPDFALVPVGEAEAPPSPFLQTLPDRDATAGFFVARLRRE